LTTASTSQSDKDERESLSRAELHSLTLFKWRYSLEALGFDAHQVNQLVFLTWLRATRRVHG
jgi:hypothetical protein